MLYSYQRRSNGVVGSSLDPATGSCFKHRISCIVHRVTVNQHCYLHSLLLRSRTRGSALLTEVYAWTQRLRNEPVKIMLKPERAELWAID